ncbi:hypothetical protein L2E82_10949 [Cichorium intybus]|uniref:Uncharacterized protein n=1 Tax=Cichorium intybus TaxID=13427 RepID=A0ACB9GBH0_CICIN|nr:hypothetical protein L2E82_10949 [Cichorium intybus]
MLFTSSSSSNPNNKNLQYLMAVVIWLFVALIITQSYTASFASMLTAQRLNPTITSVEMLRNMNVTVGINVSSQIQSKETPSSSSSADFYDTQHHKPKITNEQHQGPVMPDQTRNKQDKIKPQRISTGIGAKLSRPPENRIATLNLVIERLTRNPT